MYGYILRKKDVYRGSREYPFQESLESFLRSKIIDRCQGRKIEILESDVDTCILQLKELGFLMFANKQEKDGSVFRGITLTEAGEHHLVLLKAVLKPST